MTVPAVCESETVSNKVCVAALVLIFAKMFRRWKLIGEFSATNVEYSGTCHLRPPSGSCNFGRE